MNRTADPLYQYVLHFIKDHDVIRPRETAIVGVSGGADSVCLLHLLHKMRSELQVELHVAHLNHMLRGAESVEDAEYVKALAGQLGLGITAESRDVDRHRKAGNLGVEEAAREIRYQFFGDVAGKVGGYRIALGHTADDQAETVLMRLIRGAGSAGLQAMRPVSEWQSDERRLLIVRPLLSVRRRETERYCREHGLAPRADATNRSLTQFRNRIRHELVPLLEKYNPRINEALLRTADALADDFSLMEELVSQTWPHVVREENGTLFLNRREIMALHPALQRYLLRRVIKRSLGDLVDIEWKHIESLRSGMSLQKGKRVILPRRLTLHIGREWCRIGAN